MCSSFTDTSVDANFHYVDGGYYLRTGMLIIAERSSRMQFLEIKSAMRAVTLTDAAIAKVRELVQAEGDPSLVLRFGVRPGGCSGFSYEMYFDTQINDDDIVESFDDDVRVVVDLESLTMVRGSTLDYKQDLMGAGFAIKNPNVTSSCGCGNSFN